MDTYVLVWTENKGQVGYLRVFSNFKAAAALGAELAGYPVDATSEDFSWNLETTADERRSGESHWNFNDKHGWGADMNITIYHRVIHST